MTHHRESLSSRRGAAPHRNPRLLPAGALAAALLLAGSARAVVSDDVHWTRAHSPLNLHSSVVVEPSGSLTIDPGVELRFAAGTSLVIFGRVTALGTSSAPIRFTERVAGAGWDGIRVEGGDVLLHHVEIRHASSGIEALGGAISVHGSRIEGIEGTAIALQSPARLILSSSRVRDARIGLEARDGGSAVVQDTDFGYCHGHALLLHPGSSVTVSRCAIHDSGIGLETGDPAGVAIGRPGADGLAGGGCAFACNAVDVVNTAADGASLPARGNHWGSGQPVASGSVDASEPLHDRDSLTWLERLDVTRHEGNVSFAWQSIADCEAHVVVSAASPQGPFDTVAASSDDPTVARDPATGDDAGAALGAGPRIVFYQLVTGASGG